MAKAKDMRGVPNQELLQQLGDLRKELSSLRIKAKHGNVEQPHRIKQIRKDVARMLTVLNENKTQNSTGASAATNAAIDASSDKKS